MSAAPEPRIAIVGAGMSGLCIGALLRREGIESFTIHEKATEVGGTWRENTYPGLSCDVPARFYSYSFAPNPAWSQSFARGDEIHRYFVRFAEKSGLRRFIRFGSHVTAARWLGDRWKLEIADGTTEEAEVVVTATGVLHHPRYPEIEEIESFGGACFHSARWDHSVPLDGARIGVIGTGSTGVQIVTELAPRAGHLTVFQRSAQWILPVPNKRYSRFTRRVMARFPGLNRAAYRITQAALERTLGVAVIEPGPQRTIVDRICRWNLRFGVRDPELRRRLTPSYQPMCRRLVMSAGFYRAMQNESVGLATDSIERAEPEGLRTADGRLHELDVLVLATGFDAHAYMRPMEIEGEGGIRLEDAWAGGPRGYRTVAIPGFPNLFTLMGPHSPIGNHSLIAIAETQAAYIIDWIRRIRAGECVAACPCQEETDSFNAAMRESMPQTIWASGCKSWYLGPDGVPELWPWTPARHREMLAEPELEHFELTR